VPHLMTWDVSHQKQVCEVTRVFCSLCSKHDSWFLVVIGARRVTRLLSSFAHSAVLVPNFVASSLPAQSAPTASCSFIADQSDQSLRSTEEFHHQDDEVSTVEDLCGTSLVSSTPGLIPMGAIPAVPFCQQQQQQQQQQQ